MLARDSVKRIIEELKTVDNKDLFINDIEMLCKALFIYRKLGENNQSLKAIDKRALSLFRATDNESWQFWLNQLPKIEEQTLTAKWYIDSETGDKVLIDLNNSEEIMRRSR